MVKHPVIMVLVLNILIVSICRAHGVDGSIASVKGYCITVQYDDGEPMSYATVEINAPDSDLVFQTGRTDRNGRFMFHPDSKGNWHMVVKDGMGHRAALEIEIGPDNNNAPGKSERSAVPTTAAGMPHFTGLICGLSIIFGLFGVLYGWKARHLIKRKTNHNDRIIFFV